MRKKQIIILCVVMGTALLGLIFTQARYFHTAFKFKKTQFDYLVNKSVDQAINAIEEINRKAQTTDPKPADSGRQDGKDPAPRNHPIPGVQPNLQGHDNMSIVIDYTAFPLDYDEKDTEASEVFGRKGNPSLANSIEKSRKELKKSLGKEYDLIVVSKSGEAQKSLDEWLHGIDFNQLIGEYLKNNGVNAKYEYAIKEKSQFTVTSRHFFNSHSDYSYNRKLFPADPQNTATLFLIFPGQTHDLLSSIILILPSLIITTLLVLSFGFCIFEIVHQKKLSSIKNDFINNMTHEFKTPIATISLASQMLKDGAMNNSPSTIDHIAGIIRDESKRLTFQVEKVLQTALFMETRMKLKQKNINLNVVVESLVTKFSLRVKDKDGQLYFYPEAEHDEIFADEVHITNVISNLLDNAIKYCTKVPEISVYTRNKGNEIIISVIDNGIGIAAKEQKMIFERFYRVSTGNLHDVKGFGLGLSYVKTIVEAHNGRIKVESTEGKGSRFDIILPLSKKTKG